MSRLLALRPPLIPQQVRLNRAHPAARWCTALITFPNGAPVDWVNRRTGGTAWGTRPVGRAHAWGMACDNVAGGGVGGFYIADALGQSLYTPSAYTHLCVARITARVSVIDYCTLYSTSTSDGSLLNSGMQEWAGSGTLACYHGSGDAPGSGVDFDAMIVDSVVHAWAVASANVPTRGLFRDGVKLAEFGSGGVAPNSINGGRLLWFGDRSFNTTNYFTRGQVFLHAVFNRRLPEDLILDLTRAPEALIGV